MEVLSVASFGAEGCRCRSLNEFRKCFRQSGGPNALRRSSWMTSLSRSSGHCCVTSHVMTTRRWCWDALPSVFGAVSVAQMLDTIFIKARKREPRVVRHHSWLADEGEWALQVAEFRRTLNFKATATVLPAFERAVLTPSCRCVHHRPRPRTVKTPMTKALEMLLS